MGTNSRISLVTYSVDFDTPQDFTAEQIIDHVSTEGNWHEISIHPKDHGNPFTPPYPFMNIEFHGRIGFSLLLFPSESSNGVVAATSSKLSKPSVLVCLGGQVIEKWPLELFLSRQMSQEVIAYFLSTRMAYEGVKWIPLAEFERETVHEGGEGLISLWNRMRSDPRFPLVSE